MRPLVSICLPVKNGLSRSNMQKIEFKNVLDSIFKQTYTNFEVIISNNASTDRTLEFIKKYLKGKKKNYFLFNHSKEMSWAENFKFSLSKTRGKYIKWIASDDIISNNFIENNVNFLEKNDNYVFSSSVFFFDKKKKIPYKNNLEGNLYERIKYFFKIKSFSHNLFYGLIRKKNALKTTNLANDYFAMDWIFNLELLYQGKFRTIDKGFMIFGTNGMSRQKNHLNKKEYNSNIVHQLFPLYELAKIIIKKSFKSSDLNFNQKFDIFWECITLNIKHIYRYKISERYKFYIRKIFN